MKHFAFVPLAILVCGCGNAASPSTTEDDFRPEVDAYINLNPVARLFLLASCRNHQAGDSWLGDFGAEVDLALKPVFRRELRQRADVFDQRFLSCRAGFRYISSLAGGAPYLEHRWIVECTPLYPLPGKLVLSDRNRGGMRFISQQPFSTRYRNRLQLERDFLIGHLICTPYINAEAIYDLRYDAWSQTRYSAGVQVPAGAHVVIDTYVLPAESEAADPVAGECGRPAASALLLRFTESGRHGFKD